MDTENKKKAKDLYLEIWRQLHTNNQVKAQKLLPQLLKLAPDWSEATFTHAYIALLAKAYLPALKNFSATLEKNPKHLTAHAGKALCLLHLGKMTESLLLAKEIFTSSHQDPIFWHLLSEVFHTCNELDNYLSCCKTLTQIMPNNANMLANLSEAYRYTGDYEKAEETVNKALALSPNNAVMLYNRSHIRKQTDNENHIDELLNTISTNKPWNDEMQIRYALAKEFEDIGKYKESFVHLERGSNLRRSHSNYDVSGDISIIEQLINTFSADQLSTPVKGCDSSEPIFIMGLPRTGTTLLERIISGHSDVFAAGELHNFSSEMVKSITKQSHGKKLNKQQSLQLAMQIDKEQLGKAYIDSTRPRTGRTPRFIDKMPINYLYLGLIAQSLPKAKIVLLERNPLDTCYAIYKTLFAQVYPFSYCQEDLAKYYIAWRQLMTHWKQCLPDRILTVQYEDLVHNTEEEAKNIFNFFQLDWQSECLNFHTLKSSVSTASASQVRKPIYTSSIGKWENVEDELSTIIDMFNNEDIPFQA